MPGKELFSPAEIEAATGVPAKAIYRAIEQRLPAAFVIRRNRQALLTRSGAVCVVIDHEMPKDVPVAVRRQVYAQIKGGRPARAVECEHGILRYVVNVKRAADKIDADLAKYRKALKLIVEDRGVQAGAATFKGTRILVHQIARLLQQGASTAPRVPALPGWAGPCSP